MRDPEGRVKFYDDFIVRTLKSCIEPMYPLFMPCIQKLVSENKIIQYEFLDEKRIKSPRVGFITYPTEWINSQHIAAAELTLDISLAIINENLELKDASAWNVLFDGCEPVFCDHLSFQRIESKEWYAFGQFVRHFIFPSYMSMYRGHINSAAFKMSIDGLAVEYVRRGLGVYRYLTPIFPLLIFGGSKSIPAKKNKKGRSYHSELYIYLNWLIGLIGGKTHSSSSWRNYANDREHYSAAAVKTKKETVYQWLCKTSSKWVLDLGCNSGELSFMAAQLGSNVISLDSDHDALEELYKKNIYKKNIYPVLSDITDLSSGRGWLGNEFFSLYERLTSSCDLVIMAAFIHHLAITSSIPFPDIALLLYNVTKKYVIIELIAEYDQQVLNLAYSRRRAPSEFSITEQRNALMQYFKPLEEKPIPGGSRFLLLLERK